MLRHGVLVLALGLIAALVAPATADESNEELAARLEAAAKQYKPSFGQELPFDPKQWTTNESYPLIGDTRAKKGGMLIQAWDTFPPNLRTDGPGSNLVQTSQVHSLIYENLVSLHPNTLRPMPALASHWQRKLADHGKSEIFRYRINPRARWADGSEVTADDVLATYEHMIDPARKDPSNVLVYKQYHKPVVEDKYTIRVQTKKLNWRLFLYFSGMAIYPAKYIRCVGADYLKRYQWTLMMGSGPYHLASKQDMVEQESFTLSRRPDYWGWKERWCTGMYNFDKVKWAVIRERRIQFEKVKNGDIDYFHVLKAQRWVEECDPARADKAWGEKLSKGWILRRKIYTKKPQGFSGFVFNMRKPPFDDRRVRRAFAYLFNREKLIEKLFFNEYEILDSYWPAGPWGSPDNPKIRYNPRRAAKLLAEAGYKERDRNGWLLKDGKPFRITMEFAQSPAWKRILTVIKEDYARAGIDIDLVEVDWRALFEKIQERKFTLHYQSWGAIIFPNPRTSWSSPLADQDNNNNIPGFKSKRVDRYLEQYDELMGMDPETMKKRMEIIQKIDKVVFREYPYALGWYGPYTRILYQNRFGHPATYFSKFSAGDYRDIQSLWWVDLEKEAALKEARRKRTALPVGEMVQKPWDAGK